MDRTPYQLSSTSVLNLNKILYYLNIWHIYDTWPSLHAELSEMITMVIKGYIRIHGIAPFRKWRGFQKKKNTANIYQIFNLSKI